MGMSIQTLVLVTIFSPLISGVIAGIFGKKIGVQGAQALTIGLMFVSFVASLLLFKAMFFDATLAQTFELYTWAIAGDYHLNIGLLVDNLTVAMMLVVTFVSLFVHIYSIGYMEGDDSNQRFFSYMSLFTFAMLCLVGANDFILLFFGWEGVGLVSYLLIGFWYQRESAVLGNLKAFIVNRVGDMGFLLAIACAIVYFGSADYSVVFSQTAEKASQLIRIAPGVYCPLLTVMGILLFIGAAGKSAQVPLHVWLPESMEGPTPISALIHAATMVTAGVYMLCRMSPIIEYSPTTLSVILILGAVTALFMGLVGVVQNDIKRVIAYSTLSQLGYMMMGVGSTAYAAGLFHLFTHACFKALLFLAAGSVIIGMHHEQDMRKMGGLWRYMPVTWITFLIGALALVALPPFAGFYSKDSIIDAIHVSIIPGASFAYVCAVLGAFVTGLYTFRAFFLTFHGEPRFDVHHLQVKESPKVVLWPLIVLAVPSVFLGAMIIKPLLYENALGNALFLLPNRNALSILHTEFSGVLNMTLSAVTSIPCWMALAGIATAFFFFRRCKVTVAEVNHPIANGSANHGGDKAPRTGDAFPRHVIAVLCYSIQKILINKFGFDSFNNWFFVKSANKVGHIASQVIDMKWIDNIGVNGFAQCWIHLSRLAKRVQTGFVGHYALSMVCGLVWLLILGCANYVG